MSHERIRPRIIKGKSRFVDVTMRDGEQSPRLHYAGKVKFSTDNKIQIINAGAELGVDIFEVFAPNVNASAAKDLPILRSYVDSEHAGKGISLLAHVRAHPDDVRLALESGADGLDMYL